MALNPSCNNVKGTPFPVLGDSPFPLELAETARAEIRSVVEPGRLTFDDENVQTRTVFRRGTQGDEMGRAGIHAPYEGMENDTEVVELVRVTARAYGWKFHRAWYYWICLTDGPPLTEKVARELNDEWREQVRVEGFGGGCDVTGPVRAYHVDTLDGLMKLMVVIKSIADARDVQEAKLDKSLADSDIKNKIIDAIRLLHDAASRLQMAIDVQVNPLKCTVVGKDGHRYEYGLSEIADNTAALSNTMSAVKCAQAIIGERNREQGWR